MALGVFSWTSDQALQQVTRRVISTAAKDTLNAIQKQTHGHANGYYPIEYVERIQSDAFAFIFSV